MILWHHRVHERRLGENLVYFQLSFVPVYRRQKISDILQKVLSENHVTSFCIYEIYGLYDLIIRAWVPWEVGGSRFTTILSNALEDVGCTRVLPFFVSENVLHWLWWKDQKPLTPLDADLNNLDLNLMRHAQKTSPAELITQLNEKNLLKDYASGNDGKLAKDSIKFFIVVPPPMLGVVPARETEAMILKKLQNLLTSSPGIGEPSMYTGTGFAWILIKAKVSSGAYCTVDEFVQSVNELGVHGYYIRTYTYLAVGSERPFSSENESILDDRRRVGGSAPMATTQLLVSRGADEAPMDVRRLLQQPESDHFEVKASLKLNVGRYVFESHHPTQADEKLAIDGVLKSVVGFLNSQGGTILIGALELGPFEKALRKDGSVLADLPTVGDRIVCGINWEYALFKDMNGYLLALSDLIKDHVGAGASALVSLTPLAFEGRDLVTVQVPRGFNWYYLDGTQFYVRRSGSTISLDGVDREQYQKNVKQ